MRWENNVISLTYIQWSCIVSNTDVGNYFTTMVLEVYLKEKCLNRSYLEYQRTFNECASQISICYLFSLDTFSETFTIAFL